MLSDLQIIIIILILVFSILILTFINSPKILKVFSTTSATNNTNNNNTNTNSDTDVDADDNNKGADDSDIIATDTDVDVDVDVDNNNTGTNDSDIIATDVENNITATTNTTTTTPNTPNTPDSSVILQTDYNNLDYLLNTVDKVFGLKNIELFNADILITTPEDIYSNLYIYIRYVYPAINMDYMNKLLIMIHPSLIKDTLKVLKLAGNPALIVKV
jgi:hypothetical protein